MPNRQRRIFLLTLAVIAVATMISMPIAVAMGRPFWLPLKIVSISLVALAFAFGALIFSYMAFAFLAIGSIGLLAGVTTWIVSLRDARRLKASLPTSRKLSWSDLDRAASSTPGTLIVDWRTLGWSTVHIWWSPSDVASDAAAAGIPTGDQDLTPEGCLAPHPITPFCLERYLDPRNGNAFLVCTHTNPCTCGGIQARIDQFKAAHPATAVQSISLEHHQMALRDPPPAASSTAP